MYRLTHVEASSSVLFFALTHAEQSPDHPVLILLQWPGDDALLLMLPPFFKIYFLQHATISLPVQFNHDDKRGFSFGWAPYTECSSWMASAGKILIGCRRCIRQEQGVPVLGDLHMSCCHGGQALVAPSL
jgi:hypothetical protein